jgi:glutamyl-Q tRNA(Asp) synthetase
LQIKVDVMGEVTRFAPSPTGPLHLGHAYAALLARDLAGPPGAGRFLLRIEDIDRARFRPHYETAIYDDLHWLGLDWPQPVMRQSRRQPAYEAALSQLQAMGVTYHCTCRRGDIRAALSAPQEGAPTGNSQHGPDGPVYPGLCRGRGHRDGAIRLDMAAAMARLGSISFSETGSRAGIHHYDGAQMIAQIGDVVLARRDIGAAYHLAVVVDDAAQGVTLVSRGEDLFTATPIHVTLQRLLALPGPRYHHHRLIRDDTGKRLAKRDDARSLMRYRDAGAGPADIRALIGL